MWHNLNQLFSFVKGKLMIIACDFDDTLVDTFPTMVAFYNQKYGESFSKEDFIRCDFPGIWDITLEEFAIRFDEFDRSDAKQNIAPMAGAQQIVARLVEQHTLHIVTGRPIEVADSTWQLAQRHFPGAFSDIHFCSRNGGRTMIRSKSAVCKQIRASILLEDHPHTAHKCATDGIHVYLFDQPWNQQEFPLLAGTIIKVASWQDKILETLFR